MHSNRYTFIYAIILSLVTAVLLAFASEGLRPLQEANIELDTKTSILRSVRETSTDRNTLNSTYDKSVEELVVNSAGDVISGVSPSSISLKDELAKPVADRRLPLYVFTGPDQNKKYILPLRGTGLWGPIWGYISLEADLNTVYGAFFGHKSETPGLGAEIAEKPFQEQFRGKKIMDNNQFVSIHVVKKAAKLDLSADHRVDAISGGTITSTGTDKMLKACIEPYLAYFEKIKKPS